MRWIFYLHENGQIIGKNPQFWEPQDAQSSFVKKVWEIETEDRATAWQLVLEALALGADKTRVAELIEKWKCDQKDLCIMLDNVDNPTELMRAGLKIYLKRYLNMGMKDIKKLCDEKEED